MATKKVTINKSDGSSDTFNFAIPEMAGTYSVKFTKADGTVVNAGNVVVDATSHEYALKFGLSDGGVINAGTFTTPVLQWHTIYDESSGGSGATIPVDTVYTPSFLTNLKSGVPTRIIGKTDFTCSPTSIYFKSRFDEENQNGVFELSGTEECQYENGGIIYKGPVNYTATITIGDGSILVDGITVNGVLNSTIFSSTREITSYRSDDSRLRITKIEQMY